MADRYAHPTLECDVVMKGGITSGVVYPGAIAELAQRYRFRSIGGTSAGAIAAALVAAAEYGRAHRDPAGFDAVAALPAELAEEVGGRSLLLRLFQPDPETDALFAVALGLMTGGPRGAVGAALRRFWRFPAIGAAIAVAGVLLWLVAGAGAALAVASVAFGLLVAAAGLVADVLGAVRRLGHHDFGLCRLGPDAVGGGGRPALTGWLHEHLQAISGRGAGVLTFADLWGADPAQSDPERRLAEHLRLSRRPRERVIDLQMVTTDLTHGRPWRLPVPYQPYRAILEDGGELLFEPEQLARFFPPDVIEHLAERGGDPSPDRRAALQQLAPGRTFKRFPIGPDLPVVVATRMSLSFPLLIAAVPLHKLDFQHTPPVLSAVTFSDGGISSNFPVHLFDGALPTRPTFALHLTGFAPGDHPDPQNPCHAVSGPPAPNEPAFEPLTQFSTLGGFLTAVKDAMQNWRDNTAAQLPGARDRVVHIRLDRGEGGLNLTMSHDKVLELSRRGACAGRNLIDRFAGPLGGPAETEHWNDHRFVRFRVAMSLMERHLDDFAHGYGFDVGPGRTTYAQLAARHAEAGPYPYRSMGRAAFATQRAAEYVKLTEADETLDDARVPRPPAVLRRVPPV